MSHPNPFQPWKPHPPGLSNQNSVNYMQYISHHHQLIHPQQQPPPPPPAILSAAAAIPPPSSSTSIGLLQQHQNNNVNNNNYQSGVPTQNNLVCGSSGASSSEATNSGAVAVVINKGGPNYPKHISLDKLTGIDSLIDGCQSVDERNTKLQQFAEKNISNEAKQKILHILEQISDLSPIEKLLLYLRLPGGYPETDPLRQSQNPLGQRSEINHTINWVKSHLEHDENVSIPKQEVYDDYVSYCARTNIKPLSTADFGKVMKQVFPNIRPRRLGTRGNSRYCYAAMRKATKLEGPMLPDLSDSGNNNNTYYFDPQKHEESWKTVQKWAEDVLASNFESLDDLASHISKQHLNAPANLSSKQLIQNKLKIKRRLNEKPNKKQKKQKRLHVAERPEKELEESLESSSKSDSEKTNDGTEPSTSNHTTNNNNNKNPTSVGATNSNDKTDFTQGTNANCDKPSDDVSSPASRAAAKCSGSGIDDKDKQVVVMGNRKQAKMWAQPKAPNLKRYKDLSNEDQQENVTKRLKSRLGHTSSNSSSVDQPTADGHNEPITLDFPLSRERIESLTVIDKDELNKYLTEDLAQEEESNPAEEDEEMSRIFDNGGGTKLNCNAVGNGIPYLDNYVLCQKNGSESQAQTKPKNVDGNQLSELRNMIAQNIPSARSEAVPRPASSALAMIAHQNQIAQNPITPRTSKPPHHHNPSQTFVPIRSSVMGNAQSVGASPFVSPRSTPILKPRKPNLPPLQMHHHQLHQHQQQQQTYVKQEPLSAPNSPSMSQPFRYYPHVMNTAAPSSTSQMYNSQEIVNRSASVPIPNYPAATPSGFNECVSSYTSVNPTPVPSENNDFSDANNLLEMFSENGTMPTVKSEFFLDDDDVNDSIGVNDVLDETNVKIPNTSIISRSVPSTPLPTYSKPGKVPLSADAGCCHSNGAASVFDLSKSVPTTPINGRSDMFRYTPPTSRDYLINGYSREQMGEPDNSQDRFSNNNYMASNDRYQNADEAMIESNIFD